MAGRRSQLPLPSIFRRRPARRHGRARGFSLLEVLVAFTLFAVALGVLMQIFSRGVNGAVLADHYAKAAMYAESKLAAIGLEETLREGTTSGKFDDVYAWQVTVKPYSDPAPREQMAIDFEKQHFAQLYEIEARVTFSTEDRKERVVALSTLQLGPRAGGPL
ncbi:MAG: prepilin-type N-terminal cleavage/methylation domain-containing protein [Betaproteobacteria bacterium]